MVVDQLEGMESEAKKLAAYTFGVNFIGLILGGAVFLLSDILMAPVGFLIGILGSSFLVYRKEEKKRKNSTSTAELFQQAVSNRRK